MARREFRLPDLGEGLAEAEIVHWLVAVGDTVTVNQPLAEVETAKALVELPSPFAGRLVATHGAEGDTILVGAVLVTVEDDEPADPGDAPSATGSPITAAGAARGGGEPAKDAGAARTPAGADQRAGAADVPARRGGEREPMLVGYGPRAATGAAVGGRARRRRHAAPGAPSPLPAETPLAPAGAAPAPTAQVATPRPPSPPAPLNAFATGATAAEGGSRALAKPPVRKLARDLGVDLDLLPGTGPAGSVSRADVEAAGRILITGTPDTGPGTARRGGPTRTSPRVEPAADPTRRPEAESPPTGRAAPGRVGQIPAGASFDAAGGTWHVPVSGVRRATARAMVASAFTAPHVTEFVTADLTETMALRDRLAALPEFAGARVTPLLFAARALLVAIRRHPMINASWVERAGHDPQIVVSPAVNLGIAVASPRGLLVPNLPGADQLGLAELAHGLADLTARTRAGEARPTDLTGGTITITNVGVFGVDIGTPILNPGEAAILALGAVRPAPWVHDGQLAVRTVGQLALSFDHRLVDGELGSAVLADIAAMLTDPGLLLAWS